MPEFEALPQPLPAPGAEPLPPEKAPKPEPEPEVAASPADVEPVVSLTGRGKAGDDGVVVLLVELHIEHASEAYLLDALDGKGPKLTRSQYADLRARLQRKLVDAFAATFGSCVEGGV